MFCSNCGKPLNDQAAICPSCGCATRNFNLLNNGNTSVCSDDYPAISAFHARAKTIRTLGVFAAIFMFGFPGIIFSIIIWVKANATISPKVSTKNYYELQELQEAKRKMALGEKLALLPLITIVILLGVSIFMMISVLLL